MLVYIFSLVLIKSIFFIFTRNEIMQTDLVPSLSIIMGLPIPSGNTGKLLNKMLLNLNINEILFAYYYNTQQLYNNYMSKKGIMNKGILID